MKKPLLTVVAALLVGAASAQITWYNPLDQEQCVIQNQAFEQEIGHTYVRLPERAREQVSQAIWNLSRNSAGLAIHFYSDAPHIEVRYTVAQRLAMDHMPATGVSGVDLYAIDSDGAMTHFAGKYSFRDTITYTYDAIKRDRNHNMGYEYRLYLPLYNTVKWLEIGIPQGSSLKFVPRRKEKPIVAYGTSIAQGGCASRPAMAWTNILERKMDRPVINLGFSGNGHLDKPIIEMMGEIDAAAYILDCYPNLVGRDKDEVVRLTVDAVRSLHAQHPATPIIIAAFSGYPNAPLSENHAAMQQKMDEAGRESLRQLEAEGIDNVRYLTPQQMNIPSDGTVDNVHLTDLGMQSIADAYETLLREMLHEPSGHTVTTHPVTQRGEPFMYEWRERHTQILTMNEADAPERLIIGNSIINYWGGEPLAKLQSGPESWKKYMEPRGFRNLGFGCDRIEHVLWRVYHGELDGFEAREIILAIGTNNLWRDDDAEIARGMVHLVKAIRDRQPNAELKVMAILPRRDMEQRVASANKAIAEALKPLGITIIDAGSALMGRDGKIDESCFRDGLHPNEKGYGKIVKFICK